jgi:hypothetical protein
MELATLQELGAEYDQIAAQHPPPSEACRDVVDTGGVSAEWVTRPWYSNNSVVLYLHGVATRAAR